MIYSGTKDGVHLGFFLEKTGVQNCIELTDAEHMALIDGQSQGKVILFSADNKPILVDPPEQTTEELAEIIRSDRDRRIDEIQWRIQRYQQQSAAGFETTDTAEWYQFALLYVQLLRDIPLQPDFPQAVEWPELPE